MALEEHDARTSEAPAARLRPPSFRHARSVLALLLCVCSVPAEAAEFHDVAAKASIRVVSEGRSDDTLRQDTQRRLPLRAMHPQHQSRLQEVLQQCSQYRRLPVLQYEVDPQTYQYLTEHPDVAVSTWRVMGISRFRMWQTGKYEYEAESGDGSEGIADVLYKAPGHIIFLCSGIYGNTLLPGSLEASAVVWFRYGFNQDKDGRYLVTQYLDVFVSFPSQTVKTVAKVISPVTNTIMDRNVLEVSLYAKLMSRAVRSEPNWVREVARQMEGVLPQRRQELENLANRKRSVARTQHTDPQQPDDSVERALGLLKSAELTVFDVALPKPADTVSSDTTEETPSNKATVSEVPSKSAGTDHRLSIQPAAKAVAPIAGPVVTAPGSPLSRNSGRMQQSLYGQAGVTPEAKRLSRAQQTEVSAPARKAAPAPSTAEEEIASPDNKPLNSSDPFSLQNSLPLPSIKQ